MSKIFDRTLLHFTRELKRKFNAQSRKGRKGWNTMTEQELMDEIVKQVTERTVLDPVDLANYCAFIYYQRRYEGHKAIPNRLNTEIQRILVQKQLAENHLKEAEIQLDKARQDFGRLHEESVATNLQLQNCQHDLAEHKKLLDQANQRASRFYNEQSDLKDVIRQTRNQLVIAVPFEADDLS